MLKAPEPPNNLNLSKLYPKSPHLGGLVPPSAGAGSEGAVLCLLQVGVEWGDMGRSFPLWAHMTNGTGAGTYKNIL